MPNNYIAGFDPVAMGLDKQWAVMPVAISEQSDGTEGTQSGWSKSVGGGKTQQYDLQGNDMGITEDANHLEHLGKSVLGMAAIATGMGAFAGFGPLAGTFGTSAATGVAAGTEAFIPAAEAFTFETLGGTMTIPEIAGVTAAEMGTAATTSTLGTVANTAQQAFRATELADAAAGINSAAGGSLTSTTSGLYNIATNGIRNAQAYISEALGINEPGLLKDLTDFLKIGGAAGSGTSLFDYLMKGLQGGMSNSAAADRQRLENQGRVDVANINATNNLDILKLKDQQTQDANKRYSSSVSGINYGLINSTPKPLTRNDGSRVFSGNGLINRG